MIRLALIGILLTVLWQDSHATWANDWDQVLNFACPDGEYISRVESRHSNGREDRQWRFECRRGYIKTGGGSTYTGVKHTGNCWWKGEVNRYDEEMNFRCEHNAIIAGAYSYHDSGREDRRWKFKCCLLQTKAPTGCYETNYINDWDDPMDFPVPAGYAIRGFYSHHSNGREDRLWKARLCKFVQCTANKMTILDNLTPTSTGTRVVGVTTSQGCNEGTGYETSLSSTDELTETRGFATVDGGSYTWNTEMTVTATASTKFLGTGGEVSFGLSQSFGGSKEWSQENSKETSTTIGTGHETTVKYTGPGAGLLVADVESYYFDRSNINVEYDIVCEDGDKFKDRGRISLTGQTYGRAHFTTRTGHYNPGKCNNLSNTCIRNIRAERALNPNDLTKDFDDCFKNGVGTSAK